MEERAKDNQIEHITFFFLSAELDAALFWILMNINNSVCCYDVCKIICFKVI
ncbi:hypothetical protein KFK09_009326 [Dendrobium nobile]|uniref:Uncharacterized protein n=1 Tax=Dendrobium nobile TaxID=94219 RepID=A0A8T3BQ33_DENNO|nr:hypothetical protein KFK09_009326 [Dendrobium nobile]